MGARKGNVKIQKEPKERQMKKVFLYLSHTVCLPSLSAIKLNGDDHTLVVASDVSVSGSH